jgi:hypothetical protein
MNQERRIFLSAAIPATFVGAALAGVALAQQSQPQTQPQPRPPMAPGIPKEDLPAVDNKRLLKENQKGIQEDAQRLFKLAQELKEQVGDTDSANVLSLPLIHKAEEIEKLARHIKNLAKG